MECNDRTPTDGAKHVKDNDFRVLSVGHVKPNVSSTSRPETDTQGLPTLGSLSMDSLLAYLSETREPVQPQDEPSLRFPDSKDATVTRSARHSPKVQSNTSRNFAAKNRFEGPKEILSTPASPLLTLVKNISSQGTKEDWYIVL